LSEFNASKKQEKSRPVNEPGSGNKLEALNFGSSLEPGLGIWSFSPNQKTGWFSP
jgi:hypothetical protein